MQSDLEASRLQSIRTVAIWVSTLLHSTFDVSEEQLEINITNRSRLNMCILNLQYIKDKLIKNIRKNYKEKTKFI